MKIYDVYPYAEGDLSEFEVMHQFPTFEEHVDFALTIAAVLKRNPTYTINGNTKTCFWLPEGIVYVSRYRGDGVYPGITTGIGVELSIFKDIGDPASKSRDVDVYQDLTQRPGYMNLPVILDWGVIDITEDKVPVGGLFADMVDLRADELPTDVPVNPRTLIGDIESAEKQGHFFDIMNELDDEDLKVFADSLTASSGEHTTCSQRTLVAVTELLRFLQA